MRAPNLEESFIVTTDASDYAIGAVLGQGTLEKDQPCAYAPRALRGAELCYSTYDRKLLAVVFAKEMWRCYLYGRKFLLVTEHEPLKHFHTTKKPEMRLNKLKAELIGYEFKIKYVEGKKNVVADVLSRNAASTSAEENPKRSKAKLYALADEHLKEDNYVEKTPPATILMAKRGREATKKLGTNDSSNPWDKKKVENNTLNTINEEETPVNCCPAEIPGSSSDD